ncbi:hypothetical protein ACFYWX_46045 [Streptomyces sp. NPDC002888]|uniref:hypothetical protein n=1 Tax=Streptomyces sp. NPDC002888 TaxID=3364668 RepID=UPI00367C898B
MRRLARAADRVRQEQLTAAPAAHPSPTQGQRVPPAAPSPERLTPTEAKEPGMSLTSPTTPAGLPSNTAVSPQGYDGTSPFPPDGPARQSRAAR